jgi:hypothetical protein
MSQQEQTVPNRSQQLFTRLLAGLCVTLLALTLFCVAAWQSSAQQLRGLQTELRITQLNVEDLKQQLEAERLLSQRQIEMLRAAQTPKQP